MRTSAPAGTAPGGGLFDNMTRPPQHRRRDRKAECFRGLEIDHQLELRRLLDGKVSGLRALEDLVNVHRGAVVERRQASPVGYEDTVLGKLACKAHGRHPVSELNIGDTASFGEEQPVAGDEKSGGR